MQKIMDCQAYRELVAAHVDKALSVQESQWAGAHVAGCATCARLFERETRALRALKAKFPVISPPIGAKERLLRRLDERGQRRSFIAWFFLTPRVAGSFALLIVVALAALIFRNPVADDILNDAVAQHRTITAGAGRSPPAEKPLPVAVRLDLTSLGYELAGNQIDRVRGRVRRLSMFFKDGNQLVLAQEVEGGSMPAPGKASRVQVKSREFVNYSQDGVNLVAWQDQDLLCVLTSKIPNDKLLHLAATVAR